MKIKSVLLGAAIAGSMSLTAVPAYAAGPVVAGFDAARGGFESLQVDTGLANDISTAFPGTTFTFANTLTSSFLGSANVVILGVATTDNSAITPLSGSEQTALYNFVLGGGTALIFSDNSTFDVNAPATNASLLSPFGVTATGTLAYIQEAPIIDPTGPLTGPFTPVNDFQGNAIGYYSVTNGGQVLADWSANNEPAIDYFKPSFFGPNSGAVVLFADSNSMIAGDSLTTTNQNLILNAFGTYTLPPSVPEPATWAMMLLGFGGLGFAGYYRRTKGAALAA